MKILGDELIKFEPLYLCKSEDEISDIDQMVLRDGKYICKECIKGER